MSNISFMLSNQWGNRDKKETIIHEEDKKIIINPLRTSSIFHFTKTIEVLKSILTYGLIPNYCSETLYDDGFGNVTLGIPMVSFCDIPLSRTYRHTGEYGEYGIGLATEYAEVKGINPVFYVNSDKIVRDSFPSAFRTTPSYAKSVLPVSVQGLLKRIYSDYKGKENNNYTENEWRYFVRHSKELPWFRSMKDYLQWRGEGPCKPNPLQNEALVANRLTFDYHYINHIIVKYENDVPDIIAFIRNLKSVGGTSSVLTADAKDYLINHVTSFERIRRDY